MAGLGPLGAALQMSRWSQLSAGDRLHYDAINTAVGGYNLAQLAIGVLGVLVISGEYSTGMIRSSLMAVPRRLPVLWAKIGVFSAITLVLMLVATLISFFAVQGIVTGHHLQHSLGDPGALRTVVGSALYMTALGAMCVGFGVPLRNTAGGIAAFVFLLFVLPGITAILPASIDNTITPYLQLMRRRRGWWPPRPSATARCSCSSTRSAPTSRGGWRCRVGGTGARRCAGRRHVRPS